MKSFFKFIGAIFFILMYFALVPFRALYYATCSFFETLYNEFKKEICSDEILFIKCRVKTWFNFFTRSKASDKLLKLETTNKWMKQYLRSSNDLQAKILLAKINNLDKQK